MRRIKHFVVAILLTAMMVTTARPASADVGITICYTIWWYTVCDQVDTSSGGGDFMQTMYEVCKAIGLCP